MTKFLNLSTDATLGGSTPSDVVAPSQKAIKTALDKKIDNNATGSDSVSIIGTGTSNAKAINIGYGTSISGDYGIALGSNASASVDAVAVGRSASATGSYSTAVGRGASVTTASSIQLGAGTNATMNTLSVGFYSAGTNYQLLNGLTGIIPEERIGNLDCGTM